MKDIKTIHELFKSIDCAFRSHFIYPINITQLRYNYNWKLAIFATFFALNILSTFFGHITLICGKMMIFLEIGVTMHAILFIDLQRHILINLSGAMKAYGINQNSHQSCDEMRLINLLKLCKFVHFKLWQIKVLLEASFGWTLTCFCILKISQSALVSPSVVINMHSGTFSPTLISKFCFICSLIIHLCSSFCKMTGSENSKLFIVGIKNKYPLYQL